jgi:hypothetical protein
MDGVVEMSWDGRPKARDESSFYARGDSLEERKLGSSVDPR